MEYLCTVGWQGLYSIDDGREAKECRACYGTAQACREWNLTSSYYDGIYRQKTVHTIQIL
jgi:hypothetical protein